MSLRRRLTRSLPAALLACAGCAFSADPDKANPVLAEGVPLLAESDLEVLVELDAPPGNVTVTPNGRIFFTFHPEASPNIKLCELLPGGAWEPFPSEGWQREREDDEPWLVAPLSVRADRQNRLWVLDHGGYGSETPTLTAFDLDSRQAVHRFEFPGSIVDWGSLLNDFAIDEKRELIYIADTSPYDFDPALVVYDIRNRKARRVLEDHPSVDYEDHHLVVQGRFMKMLGLAIQLAADSIALSADGEWLYYGPLSGSRMWRIPTSALADESLDDDALAERIEQLGPKPATDGIAVGPDDSVYMTAIEHDAIWVLRPDRELAVLARSSELLAWPDGLSMGPDGKTLYVTVSELHRVINADLDDLPSYRPFRILRIELPVR